MQESYSVTDDISLTDWFELMCQSLTSPGIKYKGRVLPGFPDETTQLNTVGAAGKNNLLPANRFFQDCVDQFGKSPNWHVSEKKLVDFGCGWGRITRFFLRDFDPQNLTGIDVEDSLLEICRSTFAEVNFHKCDPFPPSQLVAESTDFIVAYSVFSHLSEEACNQWMAEFERVLRPGGMVAVTTRGRPFFDYCLSLKNSGPLRRSLSSLRRTLTSSQSPSGYEAALAELFPDFDEAKRRYDLGEFVHSNILGVTGGGVLTPQFYGESFIPKQYAQDVLSKHLEFVEFLFEPGKQEHPIMFFRKT